MKYKIGENEQQLSVPGSREYLNKQPPADLQTIRIVSKRTEPVIRFRPVLGSMPLVVEAETPLLIMPKCSALVFVNIPLHIQLTTGTDFSTVLNEIPSVKLSKTFFGPPTDGDLCLALKTAAVRDKDLLLKKPNRAGCAVKIINNSNEFLEFSKLCINTENLGIYLGKNRLWTNRVLISFYGHERTSEVHHKNGPPGLDKNEIELVAETPYSGENFIKRSFDFFKKIRLH